MYKIGEVSFQLIGTNGFHVRGKNCPQGACRTSSTILFPHSTNQIIHLWRCRRCCRRRFVQNSLIGSAAHASSENAHGSPSDMPWLGSHFSCACANFLARLPGRGRRHGAERTRFYLFLAYTKRISRNDPWDVWNNLHLFIANILDVNPLCNNKGERWQITVSPVRCWKLISTHLAPFNTLKKCSHLVSRLILWEYHKLIQ